MAVDSFTPAYLRAAARAYDKFLRTVPIELHLVDDLSREVVEARAGTFCEISQILPPNEALNYINESIRSYGTLEEFYRKDASLYNWARIRQNTAQALLSSTEFLPYNSATVALNKATSAFNDVLGVYSSTNSPEHILAAHCGLARVSRKLGELTGGKEAQKILLDAINRLDGVVKAQRSSSGPIQREELKFVLGTLHAQLGTEAVGPSGLKSLQIGIQLFEEVLRTRVCQQQPHFSFAVNLSLGTALSYAGERASSRQGSVYFHRAVEVLRAALLLVNSNQSAQGWAILQNNLGTALGHLAATTNGPEQIRLQREAVEAHRGVLRVRGAQNDPIGWATTQMSLGNELLRLGQLLSGDEGVALLRESVSVLNKADDAFLSASTSQSARASYNLANGLYNLALRVEKEEAIPLYMQSIAVSKRVLKYRTKDDAPESWARSTQVYVISLYNLALLLQNEKGTQLLLEADEAARSVLQTDDARIPVEAKDTAQIIRNQIQDVLRQIGIPKSNSEDLL